MTDAQTAEGSVQADATAPSDGSWISDVSSFSESSGPSAEDTASTAGDPSCPVEHSVYFMKDGSIDFQVGQTVFRVHQYFFIRDSAYFRDLINDRSASSCPDTFAKGPTGRSTGPLLIRISDEDVTSLDFERFLGIFYPTEYGKFLASTLDEWASILHLSSKWGFGAIRALAVREVFALASPVDKIVLGRKYTMHDWLFDALVEVCERPEPLTLEEGRRLGMDDVIRIYRARQTLASSPAKAVAAVESVIEQCFHDDVAILCAPLRPFLAPALTPGQVPTHMDSTLATAKLEELDRPFANMFSKITLDSKFSLTSVQCDVVLSCLLDQIRAGGAPALKGAIADLVNLGTTYLPSGYAGSADYRKYHIICEKLAAMIPSSIEDHPRSGLRGSPLFCAYFVNRCLCIRGWDALDSVVDGRHLAGQRRDAAVAFLCGIPIWHKIASDVYLRGLATLMAQMEANDVLETIAVLRTLSDKPESRSFRPEMSKYIQQVVDVTSDMNWLVACRAKELMQYWEAKRF